MRKKDIPTILPVNVWCKDNGYNTQTCSIPQYVDGQCPNGQPYYKQCKTDNQRACRDTGYTNSCPSGQKLKKNSGRCAYDSSYGTCCTPSGCPSYTSTNSSSYGTNGTDGCEYTCYYTCNMNCPSGTSTSNPGGCGGSTRNGCRTRTCYYPYKACCTPSCTSQYGCSCGTYTVSNGCGGTCTKCSSCCTPKSGTRKCCSTCSSSSGGGGSSGGSGGSSRQCEFTLVKVIPGLRVRFDCDNNSVGISCSGQSCCSAGRPAIALLFGDEEAEKATCKSVSF